MPKIKYLVMGDDEGLSIHDADVVEDIDPEYAAEEWVKAEDNDSAMEGPDERGVKVYDPESRKWLKFTITREWEPTYTADEGAECAPPSMVCGGCGADEGEVCACGEAFARWMEEQRAIREAHDAKRKAGG